MKTPTATKPDDLNSMPPKAKKALLTAARILLAQAAGKIKSPRKTRACRRNGQLGGRPRKAA